MPSPLRFLTITRSARSYAATALTLSLGALLLLATMNFLIDPLSVYHRGSPASLVQYRSMRTRTARAELVRSEPWDVIILGRSHAEVGLSPEHPAFNGLRVCNAALSASRLGELKDVAKFVFAHSPPKRLIVEVDIEGFWDDTGRYDEFLLSRFNPDRLLFEYHLDNLLSLRATTLTASVARRAALKQPSGYGPLGNLRSKPFTGSQRELFERYYLQVTAAASVEIAQQAAASTNGGYTTVAWLVTQCRERHITLDLVILPLHALELERYHRSGRWPAYEDWTRRLVDVVSTTSSGDPQIRLWNFAGYSKFTTEPVPPIGDTETRMKWYWEQSHFNQDLGDFVIDRIMSPTPREPDFGYQLTPANLEEHFRRLREDHDRYVKEQPELMKWLDDLDNRAAQAAAKRGIGKPASP